MKNPRTKTAAIYREAARIVEREEVDFACHALCRAAGELEHEQYCRDMKAIFNPKSTEAAWLCDPRSMDNGHRILALCFMAAMVEAGDA